MPIPPIKKDNLTIQLIYILKNNWEQQHYNSHKQYWLNHPLPIPNWLLSVIFWPRSRNRSSHLCMPSNNFKNKTLSNNFKDSCRCVFGSPVFPHPSTSNWALFLKKIIEAVDKKIKINNFQGRNPLSSPLDVLEHRALPDFQGQEVTHFSTRVF